MRWLGNSAHRPPRLSFALLCFLAGTAAWGAPHKDKPKPNTVRWDEQRPGCTFSGSDDGKYRYGLWTDDIGITLAVDAREVEIIHHRIEPIFALLLTVRDRGSQALDVAPAAFTLQFLKHFKVVQPALDPESYAQKVQNDADSLDHETARAIEKHPDQKDAREARLREYQKSVSELIEYLSNKGLQDTRLDPGNPEVTGWVFFNTNTKWLGKWRRQEEFVLRVPLAGKIFEFPFKLPPKPGELLMRKRD
jgi:hypothetical protein